MAFGEAQVRLAPQVFYVVPVSMLIEAGKWLAFERNPPLISDHKPVSVKTVCTSPKSTPQLSPQKMGCTTTLDPLQLFNFPLEGTGLGIVVTLFLGLQGPWKDCTSRQHMQSTNGYGSKLNHQGTAGCSRRFHLPGFHFGCPFLTHGQIST